MSIKKLSLIVSMLLGFLLVGVPISHADNLPSGMLIGDSEGISVDGTGAYYIQKEELMPGDTFSKEIKLMNTEKNDRPYVLEMEMSPNQTKGVINFQEAIQVVMSLDGKEVYRGNLIGNGSPNYENKRLALGTYAYGDYATLTVEFEVASDLDESLWQTKSEATINWVFIATKKVEDKKKPIKKPGLLPQTGEEWRSLIYKIITGIFIIVVILLVVKKRRDHQY
ncbi:hypothetical protein I6N95_15020 [Vagococcus sp. BWB3-3]|uniref:LPXTG cell wall anchor domain-containing protein n=1 Tax=Vagococcus allomyrinae TaxID=2794353 RepID=A0A940SVG9_9ENTE|nr:hypothetical protein [Vagococcus allomyrinae]MBP1042330.1 hypothetical protein [Vagococcus allomyrinae]